MVSHMSNIAQTWETIEAWYRQRNKEGRLLPGASEVEIAQLEQQIGITIPEQLRESLMRHNGADEDSWPTGKLFTAEEMAKETSNWQQLLKDSPDFYRRESSDPRITNSLYGPGWLALDNDWAGNYTVLDMSPGPEGSAGQILFLDHEVGAHFICSSFAEWLQLCVEKLESAYWDGPDLVAD